jgi:hypothetical protein
MEPTYIIWHPSLTKKSFDEFKLSFYTTPASAFSFPLGPREFFQSIFEELGLSGIVNSWVVKPFRSNYHNIIADLNEGDWRDYWGIGWMIVLDTDLEPQMEDKYVFNFEFVESYAFVGEEKWYPIKWYEEEYKHDDLDCIIMSDFKDEDDIEATKKELIQIVGNKTLLLDTIKIGQNISQLRINLGKFKEEYTQNIDFIKSVEKVCNRNGGLTSFERRLEKWGEAL